MGREISTTLYSILIIFSLLGAGGVWMGAHIVTDGDIWFPVDLTEGDVIPDDTVTIYDPDADDDGDGIPNDIDDDDDGDGIPDKWEGTEAKITVDTRRKGAEATDPATTAYIWYDWNHDGVVDLGSKDDGGEIEIASAASGLVTSTNKYPVGENVRIQCHASGYQIATFIRMTPIPADAWDGETALSVDAIDLVFLETSFTVTVDAVGNLGTVAMVTSTGDYNYTLNGNTPSINVRISLATSDAGIGQAAYTHWGTGKSYHQSFIAIKMLLTEKSSVLFGNYDYLGDDGTSQWIAWDLDSLIFNDADIDDDGSYVLTFGITISGAFDWDEINIYDQCTTTNFGQYVFGTQDGQETDLDFTA